MKNSTRVRDIQNLPHFAAMRHRDYRFIWIANMFSGSAMWTFVVAASWLVLERSDSSGWVGIITFAGMIPFLLVSPIAGLLADRMDRRKLAIITFSSNAVITTVAAVLTIAGAIELWHLAILAFANGVFRATQEPAVQALIPNQVPREDLLNAITLNAATRHGARFFGLLVASPLLAVDFVGISGVLVLSSMFQFAGTFQMIKVRTASRGESAPEHGLARSIADGLVYIYTNKTIAIFILLVAFHCALVMSNDSILPVFSREDLGAVDGSILGYLVMAFGVGSLFATLAMAGVRNERRKGQMLIWTGIMSGVTPVLLAFSPTVAIAVVAMAAIGASQSVFMALTSTYIQTVVPDRIRGRISSLYILHAGGVMAFANLGYGFMADALSAPLILIVTGVMFVAVVLSMALGQADLRRVYRTGSVSLAQASAGA
ncbi:MAG: MFS transporter [SAR202 cluster bacterium]|jgi:MFS family permease|nr:MFS transporter [SAR202 cluster bacterium]MDP6511688.1 MFS transporter [SAR202 cluster bacterium]MDP6714441.1 MFS transporter [SAR202 cluster bacterium]